MLFLKLNLPEEVVSYNNLGVMTSKPVAHTPEKVKGIQANFTVYGYSADDAFYAFKMTSPDLPLTVQDQFRLMAQLGFKTIPVEYYPSVTGAINALIKTKIRYEKYDAKWWDMDTNQEYIVPFLAQVESISWSLDDKRRLVRVLHTDKGDFDVIDHRAPEYYQVGLKVKINNGKVEPFMSCAITEGTPIYCPKCNNPLHKFQLASDLPLIYNCKSPICTKIAFTEPDDKKAVVNEELTKDNSFRDEDIDKDTEIEVFEKSVQEPVLEETVEKPKVGEPTGRLRVVNLECEEEEWFSKVDIIDADTAKQTGANYILTKTDRSVRRVSRDLSSELNIPLIPLTKLEEIVNG